MASSRLIVAISGLALLSSSAVLAKPQASMEERVRALENKIKTLNTCSGVAKESCVNAYGPALVTSPALGVLRSAQDGSDMLINLSSINEDLALLKMRKNLRKYATEKNLDLPERPTIVVSAGVEGLISHKTRNGKDHTDVNLSRAELDFVGQVSPWVTAAINVAYDDGDAKDMVRVDNSRFALDRGFITLGNLDSFPCYFTIGQVKAPFGKYSHYSVTTPLVKSFGGMKDRMAIVGCYFDGAWGSLNTQIYAFAGHAKVTNHKTFDHTGFNIEYDVKLGDFKMSLGGSIIGNIADVDRFTDTFTNNSDAKFATKRNLGLNARTKLSYKNCALVAEYVRATKRFETNEMTFNDRGALPQAFQISGAVTLNCFDREHVVSLGYGRTLQAAALTLPAHSFFTAYNVALFKNAVLGLEYRHDVDYAVGTKAKVNGNRDVIQKNGRHENRITCQLGVYF